MLEQAHFKIRINRRDQNLGDTPEIIQMGNPADLTYTGLAANLPLIANYNQWKVNKIVTHWRIKNKMPTAWRGDVCNHAIIYKIPNDTTGADGSLEGLMYSSSVDSMNNVLLNYYTYKGFNFKKVSYWGGSYSYKPYVSELVNTMAKNSTAAPTQATDIRRNYKSIFRYASSAVRYEAPLFMVVPGLTKNIWDIDGQITAGTTTSNVELNKSANEYPELEIYSDVYITVKQFKNYPTTAPTKLLMDKKADPFTNEINLDMAQIRQDVQDGIMDSIANSHPVIGAVAAIAGIRSKRPRDEFKM